MKPKSYIQRKLNLDDLVADRSCFLFGPRQTGKSLFLRNQLGEKPVIFLDLLDKIEFLELQRNPAWLRDRLSATSRENGLVVIDEVQKYPELLDEVHRLIESKGTRFILSGSSARKLRHGGVNLLGGRARMRYLHGFSCCEIDGFDLLHAINFGTLPDHYFSKHPDEDLAAYVGQYLIEEVAAEGLVRNLPNFTRFLEVAATCNGGLINYTSIGSDVGTTRQTVVNYFQILHDTMLGFELNPWQKGVKRKSSGASKFYMFDSGVVRFLRRLPVIAENSSDFGSFFEQFVFLELRSFLDYFEPRTQLCFWRTGRGDFEVDFIVGNRWGIEVKASRRTQPRHLAGLRRLRDEGLVEKLVLVTCEPHCRYLEDEKIWIYPWQLFMQELWNRHGRLWE